MSVHQHSAAGAHGSIRSYAVGLLLSLVLTLAATQRENTVVFLCTAFLIAIVVAGSLWVMHNANTNMMPMTVTPEHACMAG